MLAVLPRISPLSCSPNSAELGDQKFGGMSPKEAAHLIGLVGCLRRGRGITAQINCLCRGDRHPRPAAKPTKYTQSAIRYGLAATAPAARTARHSRGYPIRIRHIMEYGHIGRENGPFPPRGPGSRAVLGHGWAMPARPS